MKVCETAKCDGCPLQKLYPDSTFVAPRIGTNLRAEIGDYPDVADTESGRPFSGGNGRWLEAIYRKAGFKEKENTAFNIIQCRPLDGEFPTHSEEIPPKEAHGAVAHCIEHHVKPILESRPWQRIDIFGDEPLQYLLGKSNGVNAWRGSILPVAMLGDAAIAGPTFHPRDLGKNQNMLPVTINDLRRSLTPDPERYTIFPTLDEVKRFTFRRFAMDLECSRWNNDDISMVGLSASPFESICVPFQEPYISELKRIFLAAEEIIGQNLIQFDLPLLARQGIVVRNPEQCMVWDTMLMHHLRFPTFPHDLEFIGTQFTNKGVWKSDKVSLEVYNCRDVDVTFRSFLSLKSLLDQAKLTDIYKYISWPMAMICKKMSDAGIIVDGSRLQELRVDYLAKVEALELTLPDELRPYYVTKKRRIDAPPGTVNEKGKPVKFISEEFQEKVTPWRSSDIKKKYLYETLGLPVQRHIKTKKVTVDKGALDKLYARHKTPVLRTLKDLNAYATLLSGFTKEDLSAKDKLNPHFNVHGTSTGRLSSSGPNAQNIPGKVRYMYVSRFQNGRIIAADFSGIENRITAYLAKDKTRAEWLADPKFSEHKYLCSQITGVPYEEVQKSHDKDSPYAIAKIIVHGSDRCMGADKISKQFDMDLAEVKKFQVKWKTLIKDTIFWQKTTMNIAKRIGWIENPFGRKLWTWKSGSGPEAVSFFPQSTAADVIFRSVIGLYYKRINWPEEWAKKVCPVLCPLPEPAVLFIQVHDENVCDSPPDIIDEVKHCLRTVMEQPWQELKGMVLPVAIEDGVSWGDCG